MIKKNKTVWIVGNKEFNSPEEAQIDEIATLIGSPEKDSGYSAVDVGEIIVSNKDAILAILGARRRPRKDKGTKRTKTDRETLPHNQAPVGVTVEASSKYRGK